MKIYTKAGDGGTTSLAGGKRLKKSDLQIEAYGTVDELNSVLRLKKSKRKNAQTSQKNANWQNVCATFKASFSPWAAS